MTLLRALSPGLGAVSPTRLYAGSGPATFFVRYGYTFYAYNDDTRGASYAFSSAPDGGPPSGYCRYAPYSDASLYRVAIFYTPEYVYSEQNYGTTRRTSYYQSYGQYAWSRACSYSSSRYGKSLQARLSRRVEPATRPAVDAPEGDNRDDIVDEDIYRASDINANDGGSNDDGGRDTDGNEDNNVGGGEDNND
ncbi:hypothetical protein SPI_06855 [Niveomyces insectorum RCEF 264]|uniref:Uncharacterized protein n=1 Tax=Niveomyces insectorum RCEF 264 TaxID=1081102 RepID=A0A167QU97_9HYPO|nr:hypothetical protein SPI_06855 [Niveomyces insectorum RCEF 264]